MRKALVAGTALALLGAISPSHAAQETFEFFINGNATGDTTGPTLRGTLDAAYGHNAPEVAATVLGVFYPLFGGITFDTTSSGTGAMSEASATGTGTLSDAFDGYGTMQGLDGDLFTMVGHFGGLNGYFQTDASGSNGNGALPQNTARWLHSFVNNTGSTIVMPMGLFNNVGSDGNTKILTNTAGMLVTMQGSSPTDPVILHLYGNNGLTQLTNNSGGAYANGNDNPMFQSSITVQPGQAVSLMHVAMLFGDVTRTGAACNDPVNNLAACESGLQSDVALANSLGASYLLNPALLVGGLTPAQINSIVNWNLSGVLTDMSAFGFSAAMTTTPQLLHGKLASDLMGRLAQLREVGRLVGDEDEQESALSSVNQGTQLAQGLGASDVGGVDQLAALSGTQGLQFYRREGLRVHANGGYFGGQRSDEGGQLGFGYHGFSLTGGADYQMEGGVTLGGALAYYSTDENFNQNSGEGNNQTFAMAAYGSYAQGPWNIDGVATWSYDTYSYNRNTPTGVTQGDTEGSSMSLALRGAYSFDLGGGYLGPFAGLRYMHTNVDAYEEDGTTGFELSVDSQEMDSLRADFGVRGGTTLEAGFGTVYAQGALGYSHELLDQEYSFNSFFISTPATVATNNVHNVDGGAVTLSMGASTFVDGYTELYVGYEGFYGFDDDTQHSGVMRVTMQF